jgi:hypothetical protein
VTRTARERYFWDLNGYVVVMDSAQARGGASQQISEQ